MAEYSPDPQITPDLMTTPGSLARQGVRSFFSFGVGLILSAVGLSALVSELSPLSFLQAGSVATLAAGAVLLTALVAAPRRGRATNPNSGNQAG